MDCEEQVGLITFPGTVGECIDKLYKLRAQRLEQEREIKERKRTETAYRDYIIVKLREASLEGGRGEGASASITTDDVPTAKSWDDIWAYIEENGAHDMVQRRLSPAAVKARWEAGEEIPGVEHFTMTDLSLTKRSK